MTIWNDIDSGGSHPWPVPTGGVLLDSAIAEGSREINWARASIADKQAIQFGVRAWQAIGNQSAGSYEAIVLLLGQLRELFGNPVMQPIYVQWTKTGESGKYNVASTEDGWYYVEEFQPDYTRAVGGFVPCKARVTHAAPGLPAPIGLRVSGTTISTTFTSQAGTPQPVAAFPIGAVDYPLAQFTRVGAEGTIPLSAYTVGGSLAVPPNPLPFHKASVDSLFDGGVRVFDTISGSFNGPPAPPGTYNVNWLQIYGAKHVFTGDLILTNGLLLLLIQVGQPGVIVYFWNTDATTVGWTSVGTLNYNDSSFNTGTVREISLEQVGLEESRVRISLSTSAGKWSRWRIRMHRGKPWCSVEFEVRNEGNLTGYGMRWALTNAAKVAYNDATAADVAVTTNAAVTPSAKFGYAAAFGTTAHGPLVGFLYQIPPGQAQPLGGAAATDLAFGENNQPTIGNFRTYGIFAIPFTNAPNLRAEAESGTLGTGWTSAADAGSSGGNAAKCASGTASGNACTFLASAVPAVGGYDAFIRVRVASTASGTSQIQLGIWDQTAGAFMTGGSVTLAPSALSTSYVWIKVNSSTPIYPIAAHNIQLRAATTATTTTDIFVDEGFLAPVSGAAGVGNVGIGSWPGDLWSDFMVPLRLRWARG